MRVTKEIKKKIIERIKRKELTMERVAAAYNISISTVRRWVNNHNNHNTDEEESIENTSFQEKRELKEAARTLKNKYPFLSIREIRNLLKKEYGRTLSISTIHRTVGNFPRVRPFILRWRRVNVPHPDDAWHYYIISRVIEGKKIWLLLLIDDYTRYVYHKILQKSPTVADVTLHLVNTIKSSSIVPLSIITRKNPFFRSRSFKISCALWFEARRKRIARVKKEKHRYPLWMRKKSTGILHVFKEDIPLDDSYITLSLSPRISLLEKSIKLHNKAVLARSPKNKNIRETTL